jgi:uncharacterized protein (TIGR02594 family)
MNWFRRLFMKSSPQTAAAAPAGDGMPITLYRMAERFVGVKEIPGSLDNPQILAMLRLDADWPKNDEVAWCAAFMNYIAWLLRLPRSKSLMARSWLNVGRRVSLEQARVGWDVVILWRGSRDSSSGHVGMFAGVEGGRILLLGGNQSDSVNIQSFPMDRVLGIRRLRDAA